MMLSTVLNEQQTEIWRAERRQIEQLLEILAGWDASQDDLARLRDALAQLDELFLLVVVGEFNSGKSALINALLGEPYLAEGVTPTTSQIHVLRYGERGPAELTEGDIWVIHYPAEFLREINIVDTPGTNAVLRQHEAIARDFVPRSDLVVFVTSADRPFTESERAFLEHIRDWGKKIVVVINKIDILDSETAVEEVSDFVADNAHRLLGTMPDIFPLSSRLALRARRNGEVDEDVWQQSGFSSFQRYVLDTLNESGRIKLKLLSPLGVGLKMARDYDALAGERLQVLQDDLDTLNDVDQHMTLFHEDMTSEFGRHLSRVDALLYEMRLRGDEFFDDRLRLRSVMDMLNSRRLREDFEQDVVANTPELIERHVQEVIDWMVERELRQWRFISDQLGRRQEAGALHDAAREASSGFSYNRRQLLDSIGGQAERVVARYDKTAEARRLAQTVQDSVAMVGLVEAGAVGLGLLLKALLVGAAADVSGVLAAGVLGVLGLTIIPYRRRQAKQELKAKTEDLRTRLRQVLNDALERELERATGRLREAVAPYGRFVRSEHQQLESIRIALGDVSTELRRLQARVESLPERQATHFTNSMMGEGLLTEPDSPSGNLRRSKNG
ncbi:MAG: dynamin family protein [Anaerolineae bacterium]